MRSDPAAKIDPLDLSEFTVLQNGGELQRLIEVGRKAGRLKIVKGKGHVYSLAQKAWVVTCQTTHAGNARMDGKAPVWTT